MHVGLGTEAEAPPGEHHPSELDAGRALLAGILVLVAVYAWLFFTGWRFFVMKTAVMPIFILYAAMLRRRVAFLVDWLPLLTGTILFDALRGAIFVAIERFRLPVHATYTIAFERLLFGTPAVPLVLQHWRARWLDLLSVALHGSHFAFFLLFGLVLWHLRPAYFGRYRRAMLLVMAMGLAGYALVPSVPPWFAFLNLHLLPPITHVVAEIYTASFGELYGTFDTNPVAAMPSLHAAFPTTCALIALLAFGRRAGFAVMAYAGAVMFAIMYLGEHYAVDVVAGIGVAAIAVWAARRPWTRTLSLRQSLAASATMLGLTLAILAFR